jgi:phosphonate transport system substrate-binding protein
VEAGAVDAGALDETVFRQMVTNHDIDGSKVRVFFTTPPFVDYVWVARKGINSALAEKMAQAFLKLQQPNDAQILDILRGSQFVRADGSRNQPLSATRRKDHGDP